MTKRKHEDSENGSSKATISAGNDDIDKIITLFMDNRTLPRVRFERCRTYLDTGSLFAKLGILKRTVPVCHTRTYRKDGHNFPSLLYR